MAVRLVQYVSVPQQVQGPPHPHPHPRGLSSIVTASQLSYCKVTRLHHCGGTPQSLELLSLYISHICVTENVGAASLLCWRERENRRKRGREMGRERKSVCKNDRDTDASF